MVEECLAILAGVRRPAPDAGPHWAQIDRDHETLRIGMETLLHDLAITTGPTVRA